MLCDKGINYNNCFIDEVEATDKGEILTVYCSNCSHQWKISEEDIDFNWRPSFRCPSCNEHICLD